MTLFYRLCDNGGMIKYAIPTLITLITPSCDALEPARPAQVIYIPEDYNREFNAESGDTIIVIMRNDSDELDELNRCEDMGGELQYNEFTDILTCFDIDF